MSAGELNGNWTVYNDPKLWLKLTGYKERQASTDELKLFSTTAKTILDEGYIYAPYIPLPDTFDNLCKPYTQLELFSD